MGSAGTLVGREREIAALTEFLRDDGAGALVLSGEAGMGKSALVDHAAALAVESGARVLQATPDASEGRNSFAVLLDLFSGLDLSVLTLREPVREVLETVLLLRRGAGPVDPQVVSAGVLDVLSQLASVREVAVLVDDVQWADSTSLDALSFAARRLGDLAVRFVVARRSGFERSALEAALARRDLRYVEPRPLALEETARLLSQELMLTLSPRVLRQVHEQCGGNPLFVLEVGRVLIERGVPEVGDSLGVPAEMAAALGLRVRHLDQEQRTLLLAVALDPQLSERALVALVGLDAVDRAVRGRLVTISADGRARAWHPLLAAAAREESTRGRKREVHARLAELSDRDEARLRHRARSRADPDEDLAERLSRAAGEAAQGGAIETALELAELALASTPPGSEARARRVLDLATRLGEAGEARQLTDFLESEIETIPAGPERGRAWLLLLQGLVGNVANMERIVGHALAEAGDDAQVRARALEIRSVITAGIKVAGVDEGMALAEQAAALAGRAGPSGGWRLLGDSRDWCLVHSGRPPEDRTRAPYRKRLIWRGEMAAAEALVRDAIAVADAAGRVQEGIVLRTSLTDVVVRSGRIAEARSLLEAQEDLDLSGRESPDEELLRAEIEVRYGDVVAARHWGGIAHAAAVDWGHGWIELEAARALGMAAAQNGEHEVAVRRLREVFERTVGTGVREPGMFPVAPELIESLVPLGRYDEAREVLDWLDRVSTEQEHPWGTAMVPRSRLLIELAEGAVAPADAADRAESVAGALEALDLRHDAARVHLVVGSALRRQRQWGLAREHLARAASSFEGMGADGWAATARAELERVGGRRRTDDGALTGVERDAARLAADGLPNKSIARQLGVSLRTVEAHLTRTYAKLGVRSRAQLGARLDELDDAGPG